VVQIHPPLPCVFRAFSNVLSIVFPNYKNAKKSFPVLRSLCSALKAPMKKLADKYGPRVTYDFTKIVPNTITPICRMK